MGDAEVDEDRLVVPAHHHVGRFEVAVHDPGRVDDRQGDGEPLRDAEQPGALQGTVAAHPLQEGVSLDVLHDQVGPVTVEVGVDDAGDVGALHPAEGADLPLQAHPGLGAGVVDVVEHLERDVVTPAAGGEVDLAHSPTAETFQQRVGTDPPETTHVTSCVGHMGQGPLRLSGRSLPLAPLLSSHRRPHHSGRV
ncbi:hypothetical protein GCM10018952_00120 [Streptosporangium vulgare]